MDEHEKIMRFSGGRFQPSNLQSALTAYLAMTKAFSRKGVVRVVIEPRNVTALVGELGSAPESFIGRWV